MSQIVLFGIYHWKYLSAIQKTPIFQSWIELNNSWSTVIFCVFSFREKYFNLKWMENILFQIIIPPLLKTHFYIDLKTKDNNSEMSHLKMSRESILAVFSFNVSCSWTKRRSQQVLTRYRNLKHCSCLILWSLLEEKRSKY